MVDIVRQVGSRRGDTGRNDRRFLQALHDFAVHTISRRALPKEFGDWDTIWKRFWRLLQTGTFEAFFLALVSCSRTAGLVGMFDSTSVRAHVSVAGAKGGSKIRPLAAAVAASARKSI